MNTFEVVAGIVTLASLVLNLWMYMESRRKRAVEQQRYGGIRTRLNNLTAQVNSIAKQAVLIGSMADREETTKKELKHLAIALLATVESAQRCLVQEQEALERWRFGVPNQYLGLESEARPDQGGR